MPLPKNLNTVSVTSQLISTGELIINSDPSYQSDLELLTSRLQNQSATSGITSFTGSLNSSTLETSSFIKGDILYASTITPAFGSDVTFNSGTDIITGNLTCPIYSCVMPTNLTTNFIPLTFYLNSMTSGAATLLFGRASATNNCAKIEWDASNARINISNQFQSTTQIRITNTSVNFNGGLFIPEGQLQQYRTVNPTTFTLTGSQQTANINWSGSTFVKEVIVNISWTATAIGVPLQFQPGQGTTYLALANIKGGVTGNFGATVGPSLWDLTNSTNLTQITILTFTYVGTPSGQGQAWVYNLRTGGTVTQAVWSYGAGGFIFPSGTPTFNSIRLVGTSGTYTGSFSVNYG